MAVNELRTLVGNLDEYIHIPGGIDRLKKMVLHLAVSGQLVPQDPSEGTGEELYRQIQAKKAEFIKQGKIKRQKPLTGVGSDEVPFTVPDSWKWVRFGTVGEFGSGSTPLRGEAKYYDGAVNWFKSGELNDSYMTADSEEMITETALKECSLRLNKPGDLLIAMYGATAGRLGMLEVEGATNQAVCGVTLADGVDRLYAFNSLLATRHLLIRQSSGAAQPNISKVKIVNMAFPLPPLAEQKRIVAKVDSVFALIDQLSVAYKSEQAERTKLVASSLAQLASGHVGPNDSLALTHLSDIIRTKADAKTLRQTILHLAISGKLVPQDPSEGTGEELYRQIQAEKAVLVKQGKVKKQKPLPEISEDEMSFKIPENWKWVRLGEAYDVRDGTHDTPKYVSAGYPLVTSKNLSSGRLDFSNVKFISEIDHLKIKDRSEVSQGDILFAMIGSIGNPVLVDTDDEFSIKNVALFKPISDHTYTAMWLLNFLIMASGQMKLKSAGAVQSFVSLGFLRSYPIPLPPLAEQRRIVTKTAQLLDLVTELEKHLEK